MRNDLLDEGRPNSVVRLAKLVFSVPIITATRAEDLLEVTRPTAQAAIDALVDRGDGWTTHRGPLTDAQRCR